jgi:superoxide dismutase, Fe-Mn family
MTIVFPSLPYAENALEPHYSSRTISFHYGKHHKTYIDNINKLITGTDLENKSLEEIILAVKDDPSKAGFYNNAAQVWNHTFFWNCMKPAGGGKPTGKIAQLIDESFGSYEKFSEQFKATAVGRFGSGWGWLVLEGGVLKVMSTPNAETPFSAGKKALLTVDVWEHAYYLDYQNRRADFIQVFLDQLVNWDFVTSQMG